MLEVGEAGGCDKESFLLPRGWEAPLASTPAPPRLHSPLSTLLPTPPPPQAFLNLHAYTYVRLDGATKPEQRQILMQRFNTDPKIFCFILSTRRQEPLACG